MISLSSSNTEVEDVSAPFLVFLKVEAHQSFPNSPSPHEAFFPLGAPLLRDFLDFVLYSLAFLMPFFLERRK